MSSTDWKPSWYIRLGPYALVVALTLGILIPGLRLDRADLHAPMGYSHDALLILPLVKATIERGSHWRNERLGAPGIQELHDFPVVDHLHFALLWGIGQATGDAALTFNLFYLLTYPLTAIIAMFVARRLGLSVPAALVVGLLYAFIPYHYRRGLVHYFLSAYFIVPLTLWVWLEVCQGRLPFFRREESGAYRFTMRTRPTLIAVLIAIATASAGAYYAFFACALGVAAGIHGWAATGHWRAFLSGWLVIATIGLAGVANHAPTFWYQSQFGRNSAPHTRLSEEAEIYGLKLINLYLPVSDHHSPNLAALRTTYETELRPAWNENREASLGVIGSVGLTILLVLAVVPVRRSWPLGPLATLALFAVLVGTLGGIGAMFNHVLSPQVRAYNRISIYIAFLALVAALWPLDRWLASRKPALRWVVFALVGAFGLWDQLNEEWFLADGVPDPKAAYAQQYHADAAFFAEVEQILPEGMVFCVPYVPYPEHASLHRYGQSVYDPVRGYLHTKRLRWSFGAMKGREVDRWQRAVATAPVPEMLRRVVLRGFEGLYWDRAEFPTPQAADAHLAQLQSELGSPGLRHPDGGQVFFDLRRYRARLRQELGVNWEAAVQTEADAVTILWLNGFYNFEPPAEGDKHLWCQSHGEAIFVNPTDRTRRYRMNVVFGAKTAMASDLRIESAIWSARIPVDQTPVAHSWEIELPPGRHAVRFRCKPATGFVPTESRRLVFFLAQVRLTELL